MTSRREHLHISTLVEAVLKPCFMLSSILLLPIVLASKELFPVLFIDAFNENFSLAAISVVASLPLLALPIVSAKRREIYGKRIELSGGPLWSGIFGAAFSLGGLNMFLHHKAVILAVVFFISGLIAFKLNYRDIKAINEEGRKLIKK